MSVDVLAYLMQKGLAPKRAPGDEVHVACPFCGEDDSKRGRLYVNVNPDADIPGLHHCKLCDARGSLVTLQKFYGDATEKQEREDDGFIRRLIFSEAAGYYHAALAENEAALRWLKHDRGLSLDTIIEHQLGFADGGLYRYLREREFRTADIQATGLIHDNRASGKVQDFLRGHITIPYHVSGNVVMIRGRALEGDGPKYVTPPGQKSRLYNTDATWTADEIVITEGEFDALVLEQLGFEVVAVPGANTWQDSWDGYFTQAQRVYVVFDYDDAGTKGAEKVVSRLSPRARLVRMPEHELGQPKNDPTQWVAKLGHTADEFAELLHTARGGLLVTVDDAIAEHATLQGQVGLQFGIDKLDMLISPGLLASQVMVFLAKTGTGKTIFLLNLFQRICDAQPDAKILFLSLEQTRGDWWERARRIYRFFNVGATDQDAYRFWRDRLLLVDRNRVSEEQLLLIIDDFTYEWGKPSLIGIDYLGYWAQSFRGERYERTADAIMSLKAVAKERRLPIITPHQVNRMTMHGTEPTLDAARDSGVVEETADFVCPLWMPDNLHGRTLEERTGEFFLKLGKSRHGGTGHKETMWFAPLSLAIVPDDMRAEAQWARNEGHYLAAYANEGWERTLMRHEAGTPKDERQFGVVEQALWRRRQGKLRVVS